MFAGVHRDEVDKLPIDFGEVKGAPWVVLEVDGGGASVQRTRQKAIGWLTCDSWNVRACCPPAHDGTSLGNVTVRCGRRSHQYQGWDRVCGFDVSSPKWRRRMNLWKLSGQYGDNARSHGLVSGSGYFVQPMGAASVLWWSTAAVSSLDASAIRLNILPSMWPLGTGQRHGRTASSTVWAGPEASWASRAGEQSERHALAHLWTPPRRARRLGRRSEPRLYRPLRSSLIGVFDVVFERPMNDFAQTSCRRYGRYWRYPRMLDILIKFGCLEGDSYVKYPQWSQFWACSTRAHGAFAMWARPDFEQACPKTIDGDNEGAREHNCGVSSKFYKCCTFRIFCLFACSNIFIY